MTIVGPLVNKWRSTTCQCGCGQMTNTTGNPLKPLTQYPILHKQPTTNAMRPTHGHELNVPHFLGEPPAPVALGKVVAEFEGWRMSEPDPNSILPWFLTTCTFLSHQCPKTKWRHWVEPSDILDQGWCGGCKEDIPDGVLAVWRLYNSDSIDQYSQLLEKAKVVPEEPVLDVVWPNSSEVTSYFGDVELYGANGELLGEEMGEWNGATDGDTLIV